MSESSAERESGRAGTAAPGAVSPWEWVAAAFSSLLVLGVIGTFVYEAMAGPPTPPNVRIEVERVGKVGDLYLVEFQALNSGRTTAAGLEVEGELKAGARSVETSGVTIDYLPGESSRRAGLFFSKDPSRFTLVIQPKGYDRP
ncbi:MAG: TIGR02588 family protein [Gemmatimonadetes bacterium]|nr:TIGR02588 family protein [Gemmatimonadota bacterium]